MAEAYCGSEPCPLFLNSTCVFYTGESLLYIGVQTNDNLEIVIEKINQAFQNAGIGYAFTNGLIQPTPFQPVQLGGALIQNTTIGGNFTLTFSGNVQAAKHITTGGSSSQFVKGDGTLDSTAYQPAANYITGLSGDATASGPGVAAMTLATVNFASGTFGNGNTIPIVTVNSKGLVTNITPTPINLPPLPLTFIGDVVGSGFTGSNITLLLQNVNPNIYNTITPLKFTVNGKGLVTSASPITASDIVNILGYYPGTSGTTGTSGTSGTTGTSGSSGTSATSGTSGTTGTSGTSATSGTSGTSGTDGTGGTSGTSGSTGTSGTAGTTGTSGSSGTTGTSGSSGTSGTTGTSGSSGTSGTTGTSGSSGLSGDRFKTTSTTTYTLQAPGNPGTLTVDPGLSYTVAQSIIIAYDATNHNEAEVTSYNSITGVINFVTLTLTGSGTYSTWFVNIDGASGGDGSSGSSGTSGTSATAGTSGTTGTSGSSGTSGTTGTSGSSGTSGTSATNGTGGTSGTSGTSGTNGTGGTSGTSGSSATSGTSGTSGVNGAPGAGGTSGTSGTSVAVSGTTNTLAKFTSATTIGNSIVTDNGSLVSVGGALTTTGNITGAYILGSYFNASAGNSENPTIGQIWTQSTGDNYLRKSTPAHLISQLGLVTGGPYLPLSGGTMTGSFGLADNKLYLRTNGDNNHYLWNAADDWEELNAYEGTGFRVTSNGGATGLLYVYGSTSGGYTYSPYSFRAPIFYDSNNTGFYGDFASTSKLSTLNVDNLNSGNIINVGYTNNGNESIATSSARGIEFYSPGSTGYWIGKRAGAWTQPLDVSFYTGIRYHAYNAYGGHRFFTEGYDTAESFSVGNGDNNVRVINAIYSPIYYDLNDTTYYLDPNSLSNLARAAFYGNDNQLYINTVTNGAAGIFFQENGANRWELYHYQGRFRFYNYATASEELSLDNAGGFVTARTSFRAPIFYDSNDTGYYADFNSTSSSAIRLRGGMLSGPNTTWGAYLQVGGNGNAGGAYANVVTTDGNLHLDPASAKAMYLNYYVNGIIYLNGTTYYISANGANYNGTSSNSSALGGYASSTYVGQFGNSYYQVNTWLQFNGSYGIYWPSFNGLHIYPNTTGSYTQLRLDGVRGSYTGVYLGDSAVNGMMYDTAGNGGVYREANGRWYFYYHLSSDCMGIGTSTTSPTYSLYLTKGVFAQSRIDATIYYDSANTAYYLDPSGGSYLAGSLEIANGYVLTNGVGGAIYMSSAAGGFGGYMRFGQHAVIENITAGYHVYVLDSNGTGVVKLYGAQSWSAQSDGRIKTVHSTLENNLSKLENITPIYYSFNNFDDDRNRIGLIAQEVQEHFPELVAVDPKTNYLNLDYTGLIPVLLGAIKELKHKVETLETKI